MKTVKNNEIDSMISVEEKINSYTVCINNTVLQLPIIFFSSFFV